MAPAPSGRSWSRRQLIVTGSIGLGLGVLLRSQLLADAPMGRYGRPLPSRQPGVLVPEGFDVRLIATSGTRVTGTSFVWPHWPDAGACVATADGGWIYVANSEIAAGGGGVAALRFASDGTIVDAYSIATGTSRNCGGGLSSWGTWLSGEEVDRGHIIECDPMRPGGGLRRPALGAFLHESIAEDPLTGALYMTEDHPQGRLYRFWPARPADLSAGRLEAAAVANGVVSWVAVDPSGPDRSAQTAAFNGGEGVVVDGPTVLMSTKGDHRIWRLDLPTQRLSVFYDGVAQPSVLRGLDQVIVEPLTRDLFVAEDGGDMQLVHGALADDGGSATYAPFLQFVGHDGSEVSGPAFSPDGWRLYVSSQRGTSGAGMTYEVSGPFQAMPGVGSASGRWPARRVGSSTIDAT